MDDHEPRRLRVLSYNIKGLAIDRAAVLDVVRSSGADVVAIQEPPRRFDGRRRMRRFARDAGMVCLVPGGGPFGAFTTALLVSPQVAGRVVRVVGRPLPWKWWYRRARLVWPTRRGYALVDLGDAVVLSVHLGLDPRERADHVATLLDVVRDADPERCVVVGDLNEPPDGPSWAGLGALLRDAAAGSTDRTFSVARPRRRIDGVLVGAGVGVERVETLRTGAPLRGSDHFPVVADLRPGLSG